jgi:uroporphyrinogen-III decarboxylase
MPTLARELNIDTWDAGFPVDYAGVREALGPDFLIQTGPTVALLLHGTPAEVEVEARRILDSGITRGGRFILRDANNLSPCTPVENVAAMYETARQFGPPEAA